MKKIKANQIDEIAKKIVPVLKEEGILRASLFGSVARDESSESSDVDILIEPPEKFSLLNLVALERNLKKILNKKVDVVTFKSVNHLLLPYIKKDEVSIL